MAPHECDHVSRGAHRCRTPGPWGGQVLQSRHAEDEEEGRPRDAAAALLTRRAMAPHECDHVSRGAIVAALLAHGAVKVIGDGESKDGLHQVKVSKPKPRPKPKPEPKPKPKLKPKPNAKSLSAQFFNHGMQKTKKKDAPVMPPLPFCTMPPAGAEGAAPNPNPNPKAEPNPNPNPNPSGDLDPNLDPSPYANPNPNPNPSPDPKPLPVRGGLKPNPHVELTLQAVAAVVVSGDRAPLAALPNQINPAALNCELDATRRRWLRHAAFNSKPKPSPDPNPNPNPSLARADYTVYPSDWGSGNCHPGELTAKGLDTAAHTGAILARAYGAHPRLALAVAPARAGSAAAAALVRVTARNTTAAAATAVG
eukprot:CAMPEP_0118888168 /NCGR_PEP_ID=MMETSP1163-20130328/25584_1 /TAXON_ID=124430 /ORGANISM="Phaeomonas parva, Strain CCMP2877" /LENGTH=365 /DNA_ID=CAMNT_0006826731 /DNA_START=232 /DNA_END=1327 /DNA_ORIENTATION=-